MKIQSRLGVTIPKTNLSCCCSPSVYRPVEDPLDSTLVLILLGCNGFTIEWQSWYVGEAEWVVAQSGGETYTWIEDGEWIRVKLSKEGCCDVYSQAILYTE